MKINQIKENDIIEYRDGRTAMAYKIKGTVYFIGIDTLTDSQEFDENMDMPGYSDLDIMRIRRPDSPEQFMQEQWLNAPAIYEREPKKMTIDEISKILGYSIEIIQ